MGPFFTMEGGDSEFANFTLPTLKAFLEARNVSITCCSCYRMPQNAFFPQNRDLLVSQKSTQRKKKSTLHSLSPVIFATTTVMAFVLPRNSRFNFHCCTQCERSLLRNRPGSDAATSCEFMHKRLQRAFTRANQLH